MIETRHLDACKGGDATAYRHIVDAYFARTVRLAHALVGDAEAARDLTQEAFVAAFRALAQHDRERPFYPWLRGILVNRARMLVRTRNRDRARVAAAAERPGHWTHAERSTDVATRDLVRRALDRLDEADRTLLVLKHVEGHTYDELAATMGIPRGTVMSRLFRARSRLREILGELAPELVETEPTAAGEG